MRRFGVCVLASGLWLTTSGCSLMHNLQPHRMWRWNRGPAPSTNPFFSISDPIPQLGQASEIPEPASVAQDFADKGLAVR
jgi:hypothetical protein